MRQNSEKKHTILKILAVIGAVFLIYVAVADFAPKQTPVEKAITYGDIQ